MPGGGQASGGGQRDAVMEVAKGSEASSLTGWKEEKEEEDEKLLSVSSSQSTRIYNERTILQKVMPCNYFHFHRLTRETQNEREGERKSFYQIKLCTLKV